MNKKLKKKPNIVLYTLTMLFVFLFVTEILIFGYGGNLVFDAIVIIRKVVW